VRVTRVETQVAGLLAKYTPDIEVQLRDARKRLRAHFPRGFELIFDNYNALVFSISPTEQTRDAFISVAGYPRWVTLFFLYGAGLDDPRDRLEGTGKQVRSIRIEAAAELGKPEVRALIKQAALPFAAALAAAPKLTTTIKTVVAKQRPRRPSAALDSKPNR
jgi:hypothetical protein